LAVLGFDLYLLIDVNERIRCGIYTCDLQIVSGSEGFFDILSMSFLKIPILGRPRLRLGILFQIYAK